MHAMHLNCYEAKLSSLKLKTRHKKLLDFLWQMSHSPTKTFNISYVTKFYNIILLFHSLLLYFVNFNICFKLFLKVYYKILVLLGLVQNLENLLKSCKINITVTYLLLLLP
jgi:hypothetical protein